MIEIQLDQTSISVGDELSGSFIWQPTNNKNPRNAKISIRWYTEGRGSRDSQTVNQIKMDSITISSSQGEPIPFGMEVPYQSPITYNGSLLRVIWELEVRVGVSGMMPRNDKQKIQFQVNPRVPRE